ncbi:hypothetical protein DJ017_14200 [Phenylobacterium soli]|uniref:Uncharacterized protein n=2 Tax=Phenylobacterium soli TaxID=2170551 RepID=A0A328ARK7_9CAUL|nr:hypothetical protein DJ017_14200 [Phenylobacterium soli]
MQRTAAVLAGALVLIGGGVAAADEPGVQITNLDQADAIVSVIDRNDGDRLILDHYRINHGETYSVTPRFGRDHSYDLRWHAERTSDHKAKDGECFGRETPCGIDLWEAR